MPVPKGQRFGGRKKGTPNKNSADVRQAILNVYVAIGGDDAFAKWARTNRTEFYKIHSKLVPRDVNVDASVRLEDIVGGVDNPDNESDQEDDPKA